MGFAHRHPWPCSPGGGAPWPLVAATLLAATLAPSLPVEAQPTPIPRSSLQWTTAQGSKTQGSKTQGSTAPRTVKVSQGDTLDGIAQRYGVSVGDLKRLNGLKDADLLQVGQILRLPSAPRKGVVVVNSGDTLETIAKTHNTTVEALQTANPGIQPNLLKVGSTLRLPGSSSQPAPAAKPPAAGPAAAKSASAAPAAPAAASKPPAGKATTALPPPSEPIGSPAAPLVQRPLVPDNGELSSRGRWRFYGDTVVDWAGWKRMANGVRYTVVQPAAKDVGEIRAQATAIAVDCSTLRHTWRVKEAWEAWSIPLPRSVGQQIVLDLCNNTAGDERRSVPAPPSPSS